MDSGGPQSICGPQAQGSVAEEVAEYIRERVAEHKRLEGGVEFIEQVRKSLSRKMLHRILRNGGQQ